MQNLPFDAIPNSLSKFVDDNLPPIEDQSSTPGLTMTYLRITRRGRLSPIDSNPISMSPYSAPNDPRLGYRPPAHAAVQPAIFGSRTPDYRFWLAGAAVVIAALLGGLAVGTMMTAKKDEQRAMPMNGRETPQLWLELTPRGR